jgi:formylglycine-generating enzyme required for sulfatase activity
MGNNPSSFSATGGRKKSVDGIDTSQFPVESVTWRNASAFCDKIGARLPTEAQWEYACRAGTTTAFFFGDSNSGTQTNSKGSQPAGAAKKGQPQGRTVPVKNYPANAFGFYEMHGNVREWCRDYYAQNFDDLPEKDPERTARQTENAHVIRGGAWNSGAAHSAVRIYHKSDTPAGESIGFRIAAPPLP